MRKWRRGHVWIKPTRKLSERPVPQPPQPMDKMPKISRPDCGDPMPTVEGPGAGLDEERIKAKPMDDVEAALIAAMCSPIDRLARYSYFMCFRTEVDREHPSEVAD